MFTETALYYDKIYSFKDYPAETDRLRAIFREHQRSGGHTCSTWPVGRVVISSISEISMTSRA